MIKRSAVSRRLGKGPGFPFAPSAQTGAIGLVDGPEKVRQSIWLILETEPGERVMRPNFGCGLRAFLMRPNSAATRALIQRAVERSLASWEPRIRLEDVRVEPGDDPAQVLIAIHYTHKRDQTPASLVYPFYLE